MRSFFTKSLSANLSAFWKPVSQLALWMQLGVVAVGLGWGAFNVLRGWHTWRTLDAAVPTRIADARALALEGGGLAIGVIAFGVLALMAIRRKGLRQKPAVFGFVVRLFFYATLVPLAITTVAHGCGLFVPTPAASRPFFIGVLFMTYGLWALAAAGGQSLLARVPPKARRGMDVTMAILLVFLLVMEASVHGIGRYFPSPRFWNQESAAAKIAAMRWKPGLPYFNFHLNSRGYHDQEFFAAGKHDLVVGVLAGSFGIGVVPYEHHFATVAERLLQERLGGAYDRIAVHNFGIAGIGMHEYAYLLDTEVLSYNPRLVVLCVFVSHDLFYFDLTMRPQTFYCLQDWLSARVCRRLWAVGQERRKQRTSDQTTISMSGKLAGDVPAYVSDSNQEPPKLAKEAFLEIENNRVDMCNPSNAAAWPYFEAFFNSLVYFHATLGKRLLVVLIPDEFQVNDNLYSELKGPRKQPKRYVRDYPQERILGFCRERHIRVLDLLPALRDAQAQGRTYHLQDSHFNARGNRVAGDRIAGAILAILAEDGKGGDGKP